MKRAIGKTAAGVGWAVRIAAGVALAGCLLLLPLIILNLTQHGPLARLTFRKVTQLGWLLGAVFVLARPRPVKYFREVARKAARVLGHPRAFPITAAAMLVVMVGAALTEYLSFNACSDDFGMMDEPLAGRGGGPFMFTAVFGYGLLQQHFYPSMVLLMPLRRLVDTPLVTVLAQALLMWAAAFPLRALVRRKGLPAWLPAFACLIVLNHPIVTRSLIYLVHPETAEPLLVLTALWAVHTRRTPLYCLAVALLLGIKEDVGLYMAGFGVYLAVAHGRWRLGAITAGVALAWHVFAVHVGMPYFGAVPGEVRFFGRWSHWGATNAGVLVGWATHPLEVLRMLTGSQQVLLFAGLGFLPFITPWGWLAFAAPWLVNATSGLGVQATYENYYGIPVVAFALAAAVDGVRSPGFKRLMASPLAPLAAAVVAFLNIAHQPFEPIPRNRAAVLAEVAKVPHGEQVQVIPALYSYGGYWEGKTPISSSRTLQRPLADRWIILRDGPTTWPYQPGEPTRIAHRLIASGRYRDLSTTPGVFILRRK